VKEAHRVFPDNSDDKATTPEFSRLDVLDRWDIKAHARPTLPGDLGVGVLLLFSFLALVGGVFLDEDNDFRDFLFEIGIIGIGFYSYFGFLP
jgi:hypothetical protein